MTVKSFAFLLIFSIALALESCKPEAQDPRTQPPLVRLATVATSSASDPSFTGVVTARVQSDLGFRERPGRRQCGQCHRPQNWRVNEMGAQRRQGKLSNGA